MRTLPSSLAAVVALAVAVAAIGVQANENGPEATPAGTPDAPGDGGLVELRGTSRLGITGACLPQLARCAGDKTNEDGSFFLPAAASAARIVVSWTPANESLRVLRVAVRGLELEGESPLVFEPGGLAPGRHAVRVEPAGRVIGAYSQKVDWTATFQLTALPAEVQTRGLSSYVALGGCATGTCAPLVERTSDTFVAPWTARGELHATWEDGRPMRVAIAGTDFAVEGTSPLTLYFPDLPAEEHAIEITPLGLAAPLGGKTIVWTAELRPA